MREHESHPVAPHWGMSGDDARAALPLLRQQLSTYAQLPVAEQGSKGKAGSSKKKEKTTIADLPAEVKELVDRYEQSHPGERVEPVRLLDVGAEGEAAAPFTVAEFPSDDDMLILVLSETAASAERVEVRSRVLIARRHVTG